jgi:hypothetical protein
MPAPAGDGTRRIGQLNENALHAAIKSWCALPGDRLEEPVDGYVVDIVRGDLLIEVQTRSFGAIRDKLRTLADAGRSIELVLPIAREKWIVRVSPDDGRRESLRRSPRQGRVTDLFDELVRIPDLLMWNGVTLRVLLIREEEVRCADGRGSWRRKGVSIVDRRLLAVLEAFTFRCGADLATLLPPGLEAPFSNRHLAERAKMPIRTARRMTYCLSRMGVIRQTGKDGNALMFDLTVSQ